jgi:MFS family permease
MICVAVAEAVWSGRAALPEVVANFSAYGWVVALYLLVSLLLVAFVGLPLAGLLGRWHLTRMHHFALAGALVGAAFCVLLVPLKTWLVAYFCFVGSLTAIAMWLVLVREQRSSESFGTHRSSH